MQAILYLFPCQRNVQKVQCFASHLTIIPARRLQQPHFRVHPHHCQNPCYAPTDRNGKNILPMLVEWIIEILDDTRRRRERRKTACLPPWDPVYSGKRWLRLSSRHDLGRSTIQAVDTQSSDQGGYGDFWRLNGENHIWRKDDLLKRQRERWTLNRGSQPRLRRPECSVSRKTQALTAAYDGNRNVVMKLKRLSEQRGSSIRGRISKGVEAHERVASRTGRILERSTFGLLHRRR